ncbi:uncharacterized protein LOC116127914 [Pistacia vera]|uniref:uncharacterized protein LOC116127914 n=1 Tax=Pistacia vera TaxID=55513 RepID=UPI001262E20C|nr:uncharacterized protein LOC116127914 [Pistacia vera]
MAFVHRSGHFLPDLWLEMAISAHGGHFGRLCIIRLSATGTGCQQQAVASCERKEQDKIKSAKEKFKGSVSSKKIEEEDNLQLQRKPPARKGKEKIEVVNSEVAKQWSKVESRCPLVKQRFKKITKPERATAGVDLRSVVIQVPKRSSLIPSEEDLRSYLDPYENVMCSDATRWEMGLMLLCDICVISTHLLCWPWAGCTGWHWYCDGCRPVLLDLLVSPAQDPLPDQRATNNLVNVGDVQAASPGSGAGAPTPLGDAGYTSGQGNSSSTSKCSRKYGATASDNVEERLDEYPPSSVENSEIFAPRLSDLRRQAVQDPTMTNMNGPANLTLWPELVGSI